MRYKKKKILITDDSRGFLMHLASILTKMGFQVVPAENGLEAIKLMKLMSPDLLLLDMNMPMLDGFEALRIIRADKMAASVPIVMVSSDNRPDMVRQCLSLGSSDFLRKPIKIDDLHAILQKYLFAPMGIRRRHLRVDFDEKVGVTFGGNSEKLFARTLSEGGIFIRKKDPLPVGTQVGVTLELSEGNDVTVSGTVIYINHISADEHEIPPGMAVEFSFRHEDTAKAISAKVRSILDED